MSGYENEYGMGDQGGDAEDGYVVRVRGLPWSASHEEVVEFFQGENISCFQLLPLPYLISKSMRN